MSGVDDHGHEHGPGDDHAHDHGEEANESETNNFGIAFGLVLAAGGCTSLGASVVFCKSMVKLATTNVLVCGLAFAAGIMLHVSFVEVFGKSRSAYECAGHEHAMANVLATITFFGGMLLMAFLDFLVHKLQGEGPGLEMEIQQAVDAVNNGDDKAETADPEAITLQDPAAGGSSQTNVANVTSGATPKTLNDARLQKMGLSTALAIALHNLPEGIATFVAAMAEPIVGATLAVGIALHNIPEGLCVSVPVYYATGKRCKAFMWGMISGASEPIGALIAYAAMSGADEDQQSYAIIFGLVGGMMIMIVLHELLPTAHRYDPEDRLTTKITIIGMIAMSLSLMVFEFSGGHSHGCGGGGGHGGHGGGDHDMSHHRRILSDSGHDHSDLHGDLYGLI